VPDLADQPHGQRAERERREEAGEQPAGGDRPRRPGLGGDQLGLEQHLARGQHARLRDKDVAWSRREHVRDVKARAAPQQTGHPLLEQQGLDELRFGKVVRPGHPHQLALGQLGFDLARVAMALADHGWDVTGLGADQRQRAVRTEALGAVKAQATAGAEELVLAAGRAGHQLTDNSASATRPSRIS